MSKQIDDTTYSTALSEALMRKSAWGTATSVIFMAALTIAVFVWACIAEVNELSRGVGQVMSTKPLVPIQNQEGGILAELQVSEGSKVKAGAPLLVIDNSERFAQFNEAESRRLALLAERARLNASIQGANTLELPDEVKTGSPDVHAKTLKLFNSERLELKTKEEAILKDIASTELAHDENLSALCRLEAELTGKLPVFPEDLKARAPKAVALDAAYAANRKAKLDNEVNTLTRSIEFMQKQCDTYQKLEKEGGISQIEVNNIERQLNDARGELAAKSNQFLVEAGYEQKTRRQQALEQEKEIISLKSRLADLRESRIREHSEKLKEANSEYEAIIQRLAGFRDIKRRANIVSPVDGDIRKINFKALGSVVRPGDVIMEIVPTEQFLIEARIEPKDAGFIKVGMTCSIQSTCFDYSIYGGIDGEVTWVSPDAERDEKTGASFYRIKVKPKGTVFGAGTKHEGHMYTGMEAQINVLTGKKTVMQFLLKPFIKGANDSFTQR
ncbi:MAG: hypothetical protein RL095_419 [Verrucomicrobiota bacterium]|jgi:adhesin transport system membrane fusion protein